MAQYGERVWQITEGSLEDKAKLAIVKTEEFFNSLGVETRLSAYTEDYQGTAEEIAQRFTSRGWLGIGEKRAVSPDDVKMIVASAY